MTENRLNPRALSHDGYIVNQDLCDTVPYGQFASSYNGCGWIAAFNLLRALGRPEGAEALAAALAAGSPYQCRYGTGPRRLRQFLAQRGVFTRIAMLPHKAQRLARGARAGLLTYWTAEREVHHITFAAQPNGQLRFFNAVYGDEAHLSTIEEFFADYVRFPLVYLAAVVD